MSLKKTTNSALLNPTDTWDWENEETLVDERNRLPNRILRFFRQWRIWLILGAIILAALMIPSVMVWVVNALPWVLRLGFAALFIIFQFVVLFGFLARTRMYTIMPGSEGVSFDDYRGQPELLEQAQQVVMLLRGVKPFERAGGEPLNGLLLEGPPGTGKTWLAKAISTEAGVPFFYVDTSTLQGMFMGTSQLKVKGLFRKARRAAKEYGAAIIFMDEIDSVGSRGGVSRVGDGGGGMGGMGGMGGAMGAMGLLNTLLNEMDGFSQENSWRMRWRTWFYKRILRRKAPKPEKRVLVIGATNRISALDPALLRPGRFDKKVHVDVPDMDGRREIFEYYLSKMAHDDSMDPAILATETSGYSPADIKYVLNETLRYALFAGRRYMTYADFRLAQPEHEMGLRAPLKHISPESKQRLAYHEAGHAVAVRLFMPNHRIARITIIRQGGAFGHVWHYPANESYYGLRTRDEHLNRVRVSIAGKAAEIEFCGLQNQTLGVAGDFANIQNILMNMAMAGMFGTMGGAMHYSFDLFTGRFNGLTMEQSKAIEEAYQKILLETRQALREHKEIVHALVELLMEKEELLSDEVRAFFDQYGLYTPDPMIIRNGEEISILPPTSTRKLPSGEQPVAGGD
jgi:cell division protease FtsH